MRLLSSLASLITTIPSFMSKTGMKFEQACGNVYLINMFDDNYGYILQDKVTGQTAVIDPGDSTPILNKCKELGIKLDKILATHKHEDHIGGIVSITKEFPDVEIIGTKYEKVPKITTPAGEGDEFELGSLKIRTLYTPCHTSGHVCYYITGSNENEEPILFSGDTLFVGGCGKFFEGTPEEMLKNMRRFKELPDNTRVFCAHEYTESNLKFLNSVDSVRCGPILKSVQEKRKAGIPTVPTTIGNEMTYNLFCRCDDQEVMKMVNANSPEETMKNLREMKNNF